MPRTRAGRVALVVIAAGFVGLSLTVAIATPPWEANDEPDHARNVETLRHGDWYRITRHSGVESNQPPLYYLGLAGYAEITGLASNRTRPAPLRTLADLLENPGVHKHNVPQDAADTHYVRWLRIPSIALGLGTVLLAAATAALVTSDRWTPVVAAATVAFVPRFVFLSGVINNDNLANTLAALAVFLAVALVVRPAWSSTARRELALAIALGATFGALALTKASGLCLAPGIVLAFVMAARQERRTNVARLAAVAATTAVLIAGWWFVLATIWYGDPVAATATHDHYTRVASYVVDDAGSAKELFIDLPKTFWRSFWYTSGWNQLRWSAWASLPFWGLLAAGLVGLTRRGEDDIPTGAIPTLALLALAGPAAVFGLALTTETSQGRIAFVGLAAIATLYALGVERLRVPVLARFVLPAIGIVGTAIALEEHVIGLY